MSVAYGVHGPSHSVLGELAYRLSLPVVRGLFASRGFHRPHGRLARELGRSMRERLASGDTVYLLGIGAGSHNAGAALVEVSSGGGVRLLCNNEEERYMGIKHYAGYPHGALDAVLSEMETRGIRPDDLHACLVGFDHAVFVASGLRRMVEEFPSGVNLARAEAMPEVDQQHAKQLLQAPDRLAKQLGVRGRFPIIGMRHHDTHAWFSYATSPFAHSEQPVLVTVIDGNGDDNSISIYLGAAGKLQLLRSNGSLVDSLGSLYRTLASTQGGWTPLSSEGRYMGATAWGNNSRLTKPGCRGQREYLAERRQPDRAVPRSSAGHTQTRQRSGCPVAGRRIRRCVPCLARRTRRAQRLRAHSPALDTGMGTGTRRFARRETTKSTCDDGCRAFKLWKQIETLLSPPPRRTRPRSEKGSARRSHHQRRPADRGTGREMTILETWYETCL
jgi:hypothetical protein